MALLDWLLGRREITQINLGVNVSVPLPLRSGSKLSTTTTLETGSPLTPPAASNEDEYVRRCLREVSDVDANALPASYQASCQ
ncbi:MAG: hypothetical protein ACREAB_00655 [Blastocatellia bacterium]